MRRVGVVVGRFQVPELHDGHRHLLNTCMIENDVMVVVLGSPKFYAVNRRNPLHALMRMHMIKDAYPKAIVFYIEDEECDEKWSTKLDKKIELVTGDKQVTLYGSRDSFHLHYKGSYPYKEVGEVTGVSGSDARRLIKFKSTKEFREGMIYAVMNHL